MTGVLYTKVKHRRGGGLQHECRSDHNFTVLTTCKKAAVTDVYLVVVGEEDHK